MKEKDTNAEARFAAFRDYYESGLKAGTIKSKTDFARQLGVVPNTVVVAFRNQHVTRTLYLRLQGLAAGFKNNIPDSFVQIPADEYEQMRKTIADLSAANESQARTIERLIGANTNE